MPRRLLGLMASMLWLSGCGGGILDPQGPVGRSEESILLNSLGIMLAVVVPTIIATLVFAWWFRAANTQATYRPEWTFSGQIELVVWAIPAMVVILLGGIAWIGSHELEPSKPLTSTVPPLLVEVVSLDWKWLFIYPEQGVASVNRLVVPAATPIAFRLTSGSVMNSFFVPELGSQIYTMAGMATRLHLQADRPGRFHGLSAQFSGEGFVDMHFSVDAVTHEAFDKWTLAARRGGKTLDAPTFAAFARPSSKVAPVEFGRVEAGLFDRIVQQSSHASVRIAAATSAKPR